MLLRNFAGLIHGIVNRYNDGTSYGSSFIDNLHISDSYDDTWWTSNGYYNQSRVIIGSGTASVNFTDYKLDDDSPMGNTVRTVASAENTYQLDNKIISIATTYQNVSSSPVTITEVGLCHKWGGSSTLHSTHALISRTLLETPIVMQPGEQYTFTITISI